MTGLADGWTACLSTALGVAESGGGGCAADRPRNDD
jgi:hypothetical protein